MLKYWRWNVSILISLHLSIPPNSFWDCVVVQDISYGKWLTEWTILVAWHLTRSSLFWLPMLNGHHIMLPYSSSCLTIALMSSVSVFSLIFAKKLLSTAGVWWAFDTATDACFLKFRSLSIAIPRSFSLSVSSIGGVSHVLIMVPNVHYLACHDIELKHPLLTPLAKRNNVCLQANIILIDYHPTINLCAIGEELDVAGDFQGHVVYKDREEDWPEDWAL